MKIFSAWGLKEEKEANCLIEGNGPPRFANGEIDTSSPDFYFIIQACSLEEAMAIFARGGAHISRSVNLPTVLNVVPPTIRMTVVNAGSVIVIYNARVNRTGEAVVIHA